VLFTFFNEMSPYQVKPSLGFSGSLVDSRFSSSSAISCVLSLAAASSSISWSGVMIAIGTAHLHKSSNKVPHTTPIFPTRLAALKRERLR
jgi:hypothetical protein